MWRVNDVLSLEIQGFGWALSLEMRKKEALFNSCGWSS